MKHMKQPAVAWEAKREQRSEGCEGYHDSRPAVSGGILLPKHGPWLPGSLAPWRRGSVGSVGTLSPDSPEGCFVTICEGLLQCTCRLTSRDCATMEMWHPPTVTFSMGPLQARGETGSSGGYMSLLNLPRSTGEVYRRRGWWVVSCGLWVVGSGWWVGV